MSRDSASQPSYWLVGVAFMVSGFTSLVLEIVWSKALALMLGSTLHAVSTVVAAYLFGLALGAFLAGRVAHRLTRPLRLYGFLEMGVGAYALVSLFLIHALDPPVGALYARLGGTSAAYLGVRVALAGLVLIVPTVLMGATLPSLVAWASRESAGFGKSLGRLYGLNTLGAVAGSALAGAWLVPQLGLAATTYAVGALALVVGAWMAALGSRGPAAAATAHPTPERAPAARPLRFSGWAAVLFALSGATALVLEITWARIFGLVFGSSVYSFAIVLASYLLAIALGSLLWGGRLAESRSPWLAFGVLQIGVSAGAAVGLWLLPELPRIFLSTLFAQRQNLAVLYFLLAAIASLVTFLPCLALGALFPVGTRLIAGGRMPGARATGIAYAANTAGTLTGSLAAGFYLLPTIGVHATWVGASIVSLALGVAALLLHRASAPVGAPTPTRAPARSRKQAPAPAPAILLPAAVVAVGLANLFSPAWSKALFTLGVYRTASLLNSGITTGAAAVRDLEEKESQNRILFYKEGLHGIVSVHESDDKPPRIAIRVNGKPDASTGSDMATQILSGYIPMLWAPPGAEVCLIGQGSGITTRSVLTHDVKHLTLVEIERAVLEASRFFDAYTDTVLSDPRLEVIVEDGRQHLQHSGRTYDVVISEPSNPWVAGTNNLFTVDFYRRVRAALRPHGVFCQWIQSYEISPVAMASLLRSVALVFPDAQVYLVGWDFLLVAPPPGERLPFSRMEVENDSTTVARFLRRNNLHWNGTVPGSHLGRVASILPQLPAAPLNTDDRPFVEYRAPVDLYRPPVVDDPWNLGEKQPIAALASWIEPADVDSAAFQAALFDAQHGHLGRARLIAEELRAQGGEAVRMADVVGDVAARADRLARIAALQMQAHQAFDANRMDVAQQALAGILALEPENAAANLLAGRGAMRSGDLAAARRFLAVTARAGTPFERAGAHNNLGILDMREGRSAAGRAQFETALSLVPGEPMAYVYLARWYVAAGRPDSARAMLERGLAVAEPTKPIQDELATLR